MKITKVGIPQTGYSNANTWKHSMQFLYNNPELVVVDITRKVMPNVDLILFDGGEDVFPGFYGEKVNEGTHFNKKRDFLEAEIFQYYENKPTIFAGICRGCQFLNVMKNGTLYQDLSTEKLEHPSRHNVILHKKSSLAKYVNRDIFIVNSFHHQAVKDLGTDLNVVLRAYHTKVIEGIETIDGKIRAIQSHPEFNGHEFAREILCWLLRIDNKLITSKKRV